MNIESIIVAIFLIIIFIAFITLCIFLKWLYTEGTDSLDDNSYPTVQELLHKFKESDKRKK